MSTLVFHEHLAQIFCSLQGSFVKRFTIKTFSYAYVLPPLIPPLLKFQLEACGQNPELFCTKIVSDMSVQFYI